LNAPRTLLWVIVLVLAAVVVYRLRGGDARAEQTLPSAAVPAAAAYARAVVSAERCDEANDLADRSLRDACETFAGLHGLGVGAGRIVRGCTSAPLRVRQDDRVEGADCVAFPLTGAARTGTLSVWLRRDGDRWLVASAASALHAR